MNVLVACEESQRVAMSFRDKGHYAFSCDVLPCSGGHPEYHIQGDALEILNGGDFVTMDGRKHHADKWDLLIAHPPCTYLSNAGARHLWKGHELQSDRVMLGIQGRDLFMRFWWADIPLICVENPVPIKSILPAAVYAGHSAVSIRPSLHQKTCLWLKGLPPLESTNVVEPVATWCPSGSYSHKHGGQYKGMFTTDRAKNRAKTFPGVAKVMADQWG